MLLVFLLVLVLLCSVSATATASGKYGKYLPPDQAFQLQAKATADSIILDWHIADGYYLYRDKISIQAPAAQLGKICLPPGVTKTDPYFGQTEVYHHDVQVGVSYAKPPPDGPLQLTVTYQGCAEAGLCYPPIVKQLTVAQSDQWQTARAPVCSQDDASLPH